MSGIGQGSKRAILVVDVQKGVVERAFKRDEIISNINIVLDKGRSSKIPILFIQHCNSMELPEGSEQWQIVPELQVAEEDHRIQKCFNSAFEATDLNDLLKSLGITKIILVGAATNWCIRATCFGALERGYDVILIEDAHTTFDMQISENHIIHASDIINEFNLGVKYVEYAACKTTVIGAAEIAFND